MIEDFKSKILHCLSIQDSEKKLIALKELKKEIIKRILIEKDKNLVDELWDMIRKSMN